MRNALPKPCVSAAGSGRNWSTFAKATVESTATPSAPPTCWDVLMRPEARPASCGFVPATAPIVTGTNEKPRPAPATIIGPRRSVA